MIRRVRTYALLSGATAFSAALAAVNITTPEPETVYLRTATISVAGTVSPLNDTVVIEISRRINGVWTIEDSEFATTTDGEFSGSLSPPEEGWPIGDHRIGAHRALDPEDGDKHQIIVVQD